MAGSLPVRFLLRTDNAGQRRPSRRKFDKTEDDALVSLVARFGEQNWSFIAGFMDRRTARQCRERYKNYLSPSITNRPWLPEEDALLAEKVAEFGQKWARITAFFEGRSDVNVKNHWATITSRNERVHRFAKKAEHEAQQHNGPAEGT
jgi:N-glycosylase/DNA lyase